MATKFIFMFYFQLSGSMSPVDADVIKKIQELVGRGCSSVKEVQRAVALYVEKELFLGNAAPDPLDRAFRPTDQDVRNHMYIARSKLRLVTHFSAFYT